MTPLELALDYARHGLPVIPVRPRSKVPDLTAWTERATTAEEVLRGWWTETDSRGVGVATGHPHPAGGYLIVLDVDEHDPAASGEEALADLSAELGALPGTYTVLTPTGGRHIYLRATRPLTNAAGSNLPAGIDVRGAGGYVLAPPSEHPNGGTYDAEVEYAVDEVAAMPAAWEARLATERKPSEPSNSSRPNPGNVFGAGSDRPGDAWAAATTWEQILTADGWTHAGRGGDGEDQWTRPGKTVREGISATTSYGTHDVLKVFTSNAPPLRAEETYTKLGYLAETKFSGDYDTAVDHLRDLGYGAPRPTSSSPTPETVYEAVDPSQAWETPAELDDTDRPPFPVEVLPAVIRAQVENAAVEMQLTADLAAQLAMTALSVIAAGRVEVKVDGRHREPCHLYNVTALPPSTGKSPTFRMMLGALDRWEEDLVDRAAEQIDDRNIARKIAEKERDDAIKQGDATRAKMAADDLRDNLGVIHTPRLMADDATPEKLVELLDQQGGRMALVSTEGGLFGMMTGRYSDKANLDVYLGAWSGDTIRVDRIERGSTVVRRPALTVGLTVQPSVLADVGRNRELVGRGLTARFMYALPADTVGHRDKERDSTYDDTVEDRYSDALLSLARSVDAATAAEPMVLEFTPEARKAYKRWQARREDRLDPHGSLRYMAEWIAKCDSSVARLAGLLHLVSGELGGYVEAHTVEAAMRVGDYWTDHARAVFDLMGASDDLGHARYLLDWLRRRDDPSDDVTFRDLHQHAKRRVDSSHDLVPAVELLVEHGWLRPLTDGKVDPVDVPLGRLIGKGKTSPRFQLHPRLIGPHTSHCPHIGLTNENEATETENVRDVRDVSPRHPESSSLPLDERQSERTPDTRLTSLTSPSSSTPDPDPAGDAGPPCPF